jgi:hypothetical protein
MAENVAAACKKVRRFKWLFLPFRLRIQHLIYLFQISVLLNHAIVQQPFHHPQTAVDKPYLTSLNSRFCWRFPLIGLQIYFHGLSVGHNTWRVGDNPRQ